MRPPKGILCLVKYVFDGRKLKVRFGTVFSPAFTMSQMRYPTRLNHVIHPVAIFPFKSGHTINASDLIPLSTSFSAACPVSEGQTIRFHFAAFLHLVMRLCMSLWMKGHSFWSLFPARGGRVPPVFLICTSW